MPTIAYSCEAPDSMHEEADFHRDYNENKAYVLKGHPAGWLELPSDVGYELREAPLCGVQATRLDRHTAIGWSFKFTLDGEPVDFIASL
jgi:hypothetical protein